MEENRKKRLAVRFGVLAALCMVLLAALVLAHIFGGAPSYTEPAPLPAGQQEALTAGEYIADDQVPLAGFQTEWSLLNLAMVLACVITSLWVAGGLVARARRGRRAAGGLWAAAALLVGFGPPMMFAFTQNLSGAMRLADGWTLGLVTLLVLQCMLVLLMRRARYIQLERQYQL